MTEREGKVDCLLWESWSLISHTHSHTSSIKTLWFGIFFFFLLDTTGRKKKKRPWLNLCKRQLIYANQIGSFFSVLHAELQKNSRGLAQFLSESFTELGKRSFIPLLCQVREEWTAGHPGKYQPKILFLLWMCHLKKRTYTLWPYASFAVCQPYSFQDKCMQKYLLGWGERKETPIHTQDKCCNSQGNNTDF